MVSNFIARITDGFFRLFDPSFNWVPADIRDNIFIIVYGLFVMYALVRTFFGSNRNNSNNDSWYDNDHDFDDGSDDDSSDDGTDF